VIDFTPDAEVVALGERVGAFVLDTLRDRPGAA
jgi:hypothetical protein